MKKRTAKPDSGASGTARNLVICSLLIAATACVYVQVWEHEFVTFDDRVYLVENEQLRNGLSLDGLRWAFTTTYANFWHPVTWVSMLLDYELFELEPWGHHLSALVYHIVNTLLLFAVLNRMTRAPWASALVAALFALHPLHVESVAWASQRKDLLSTLFGLLAIWAYAGYAARPGLWRYAAVAGLFVFSLMAKPMLVTLPFVLLLLDYWPLKRIRLPDRPQKAARRKAARRKKRPSPVEVSLGRCVVEKLPLLAIAAAFSAVAVWAQQKGGAVTSGQTPLLHRLANAALSYVVYVRKTFWPSDLAIFYPFQPTRPAPAVAASVVLLLVISLLVIHQIRRRRYLIVGWFLYLGTLVPVIGLVKVGGYAMADRFTYVPLVGLFVMIAWGLAELAGKRSRRRLVVALSLAAVAACGAATWGQLRHWKNTTALFEHAISVTENNYVAHTSIAVVLKEAGRFEEAADRYRRALGIAGTYTKARAGLAEALFRLGRYDEAISHLQYALGEDPNDVAMRGNLGEALISAGRAKEALDQYRTAVRLSPGRLQSYRGLSNALARLGRYDEALPHRLRVADAFPSNAFDQFNLGRTYQKLGEFQLAEQRYRAGLEIEGGDVPARRSLGVVLAEQGKHLAALEQIERAVALSPDDAPSHYRLGDVFNRMGRDEEALDAYRRTVSLQANHVGALNSLGWLLATHPDERVRNGPEALAHALKACDLTSYEDAVKLDTLAAAYAETGQFDRAVATMNDAIEKLKDTDRSELPDGFRARLELYQDRRPYRRPASSPPTDATP